MTLPPTLPNATCDRRGNSAFAYEEVRKLRDALGTLSQPDAIDQLVTVAAAVAAALAARGRVFFCGNGGSAADAQHLAAELVGRQNYDRLPAAGIALTVDSSVLTAVGNDYGFDHIFSRQIDALGRSGDVLVGLSTSGRSANVVNAVRAAAGLGLTTVAFTGCEPRDLAGADHVVALPSRETAKIQELTLVSGHIVFALVERSLFPPVGVRA